MAKPSTWPNAPAPGIASPCPPSVSRLMKDALRSVDRDIELRGELTEKTINEVRAALALARNC